MQELRHATTAKPGEIWFIEQALGSPLGARDRGALTSANVVLYERALAPLVASVLPIGAYAEALPANADAALSPRAVNFAGEGWSVAQLVGKRSGSEGRMPGISTALTSLARLGDLPVLITAKNAAGRSRVWDACLQTAPDILRDLSDDTLVTLVVGPLPLRYAAPTHALAANGLAG